MKKRWGECDSCGHETMVKFFDLNHAGSRRNGEELYTCAICSNSWVANALWYPDQYHDSPLMKTVAVIGNMIMDRVTPRYIRLWRFVRYQVPYLIKEKYD